MIMARLVMDTNISEPDVWLSMTCRIDFSRTPAKLPGYNISGDLAGEGVESGFVIADEALSFLSVRECGLFCVNMLYSFPACMVFDPGFSLGSYSTVSLLPI